MNRYHRLLQMRIRRLAARARADRELPERQRTILASLWIAASFVALVGAAIEGDERQQRALAAEQAELQAELMAEGHRERSSWADHPNESRCGRNCIARLPTSGETWEFPE